MTENNDFHSNLSQRSFLRTSCLQYKGYLKTVYQCWKTVVTDICQPFHDPLSLLRSIYITEQLRLLYLPTQIHFPIAGESITCHGPNLTNSFGKQELQLSTSTWPCPAPWNHGKFVCQTSSRKFNKAKWNLGKVKTKPMQQLH